MCNYAVIERGWANVIPLEPLVKSSILGEDNDHVVISLLQNLERFSCYSIVINEIDCIVRSF